MRTLVHLRHGERQPGGPHLTERGARLAKEVGRRLAHFDRVLTSPKPRAVETAEAMGYAVEGSLPALGGLPGELERWVDRAYPPRFADYLRFVDEVAEARVQARRLADLAAVELERLGDGGRLLFVSHGGVVELGAVGALGAAVAEWGPVLGYLEGVELERDRATWTRGAPVRAIR